MSTQNVIHNAISRIRRIRYELEGEDLSEISDELEKSDEFKDLCIEIAEEAIEKELQAKAIAERIGELTERKNRLLRTVESLRNLILQCMDIRKETTIQSAAVTLNTSIRSGGIVVEDEALIPSRFFKPQPPLLDKSLLKEAVLKDGEVIEGVSVEGNSISLTIRRR